MTQKKKDSFYWFNRSERFKKEMIKYTEIIDSRRRDCKDNIHYDISFSKAIKERKRLKRALSVSNRKMKRREKEESDARKLERVKLSQTTNSEDKNKYIAELKVKIKELEFQVKALCEIGDLSVEQTWWYELKNKEQ